MNFTHRVRLMTLSGVMLGALASGSVLADEEVGQWYMTPMISFIDDDKDRGVDDELRGGQIGFGKVLRNNWRVEMSLFGADLKDQYRSNDQELRGVGVDLMRRFSVDSLVSSYVLGGVGYLDTDYDLADNEENLVTSLGVGLLTRLGDNGWALRTEARLRTAVGDDNYNDIWYNVGLQVPLGSKAAPMPADSDGDGVYDGKDRCPGTAAGITVDAMGCEVVVKKMDSDNDGVEDKNDRCPSTPAGATVDARGCELDSDNDGVVNSKDRCPNTASGSRVDDSGCMVKVKVDLTGVQFEYDSAKLKPESNRILDNAAATLKRYPDIEVLIAGHTDSVGSAGYNLRLSQERAESVATYLVSKGISALRMQTRGYGESEPRASNDTDAGRALNRRVELRVLNQ